MKNQLKPTMLAATICVVCCVNSAQAATEDVTFGDWTVSINPAAVEVEVAAPAPEAKRERVVREIHEVRYVRTQYTGPRFHPYGYYYGGSNYSIYFPWRNYRSYGFSSYYRPRTIYNYGYGW